VINQQSECIETAIPINRDWLARQSWPVQAGLLIGLLHLLFMLANIAYMIHNSEGRWHMFWIICGYIDFPVSLLLSKVILPVFASFFTHADPYVAARYNSPLFWVFSLFHVLVGSAWYSALPFLIHKASKKITATTAGASIAAAIMIIPIPANWIQLLRFIGYDTAPTAIGLNSVLPCVWMVLLAWLFLTNSKRKAMLWLFCLAPLVFYYLIQDLYYYRLFAGH
jgi:hypothetical protein